MRRARLDSNLKYPWQEAVRDALTEYHTDQIPDKVTAGERAISERRRQSPTDIHELLALRDALFALQIVFPGIMGVTRLKCSIEPAITSFRPQATGPEFPESSCGRTMDTKLFQ